MRKLSSGRLSNLPKVTQVVGDKAGHMNPGSLTPAPTLSTTAIFVPARWLPGCQRKDPGGSETSRSLLSASAGFGRRRDRKSGLPSQLLCPPHSTAPRGVRAITHHAQLQRRQTSNRDGASYDVPTPTPARPFQKEGAALGFCCEGAHKNEAAFTKRTRACEGVSWPRSHSDIPSKGRPPRLRRSASHNNGPQVFLGVWVPAAPRL